MRKGDLVRVRVDAKGLDNEFEGTLWVVKRRNLDLITASHLATGETINWHVTRLEMPDA